MKAYIAVNKERYISGVCLENAQDADEWVADMVNQGMKVKKVPAWYAKRKCFTYLQEFNLQA